MSIKPNRWFVALTTTLLIAAALIFSLPTQVVYAVPLADSNSNTCLACHEDLYYLHDTGKYYCLTEHADRCVNCHQGDSTVLNKEASHQGLVAFPQKDNGQKCRQCHTQDAQARLDKFASLAGYKPVIEAQPYTPVKETTRGFPAVSETNAFIKNLPWVAGAFVLFGLWLALVMRSSLKP
jgi:hypothetical protein